MSAERSLRWGHEPDATVSRRPIDPLVGIDRLLVDGTNLLHAMRQSPGAAPAAALIGRLRAAVPPSIGIELVFDGPPDPGLRGQRIASGLIVRHSGRRTGDDLLRSVVDDARAVGAANAARILVVTDDAFLRSTIHARGGTTIGSKWLIHRLDRPRLSAPSVGNRRPPSDGRVG